MSDRTLPALAAFEWLLVWAALIATGSLVAMPISVTPSFRELVGDFGGELPALTAWVFAGWLPILAALPPAALLLIAWKRPGSPQRRRLLLALSAGLAALGLAVCLAGYAGPLFGAVDSVAEV